MASTFSKWNFLPDELQLRILEQRLCFTVPITRQMHGSIMLRALLPLLLVNKKIHAMVTQIYYGTNSFVLKDESSGRYWEGGACSVPNFAPIHRVRRFELRLPLRGWQSRNNYSSVDLIHVDMAGKCCFALKEGERKVEVVVKSITKGHQERELSDVEARLLKGLFKALRVGEVISAEENLADRLTKGRIERG